MDDDYTEYLLVRNFSKNPEDKLSDAELKYLFLLEKSLPEHRFEELSKIAKNTLKLRKELGEEEHERERREEEEQFRLRDLEIENLQNPVKAEESELKATQARVKLLETELSEAERAASEHKREIQRLSQENQRLQSLMQQPEAEDYARLYEDEKENSYELQEQLFTLNRELGQYKEFTEKLEGFCTKKGDLQYMLHHISQIMNTRIVKINAASQLSTSIIELKERVRTLKEFCRVGLDLSEVNEAIRKALIENRVEESISMVKEEPTAHERIFLKSNTNEPVGVYQQIIPEESFSEFAAPLLVNILSSSKAFEFNQASALQDVLEICRFIAFKPFVLSSFALINGQFADAVSPQTVLSNANQALKIEINEESELFKVINLIYRKSVGAKGLALCFYKSNMISSIICCRIALQNTGEIEVPQDYEERYEFDE